MAYKLVPKQEPVTEQKAPTPVRDFLESTAHQIATGTTAMATGVAGLPGDLFALANKFIAGPISEKITGEKALPYEETFVGKAIPTSQRLKEDLGKLIPYTKPRNEMEKFTNDIVETGTILLTPGGQAKLGRFLKMNPVTRAFFKAVGAHTIGKGVESLTASKEKGNLATMGSLLTLSLLDRTNAAKYVGNLYKKAQNALTKAGNPRVNANAYVTKLENLRESLSKGTLAPSESAVVSAIDKALTHAKASGDSLYMPVENLWGISRSLNEIKTEVARSAKSKAGGLRARQLFDKVIRDTNEELSKYAAKNPEFGKPFMDAQQAFATLAKSNFITNSIKKLSGLEIRNPGLLHLLGGGAGSAVGVWGTQHVGSGMGLMGGQAALGYQASKLLYRVMKSPVLRKYYFEALKEASKGNIPQLANKIKKMDSVIEKEDKVKKPYRIIKKD